MYLVNNVCSFFMFSHKRPFMGFLQKTKPAVTPRQGVGGTLLALLHHRLSADMLGLVRRVKSSLLLIFTVLSWKILGLVHNYLQLHKASCGKCLDHLACA